MSGPVRGFCVSPKGKKCHESGNWQTNPPGGLTGGARAGPEVVRFDRFLLEYPELPRLGCEFRGYGCGRAASGVPRGDEHGMRYSSWRRRFPGVVGLAALGYDARPSYCKATARQLRKTGMDVLVCTPERLAECMGKIIRG